MQRYWFSLRVALVVIVAGLLVGWCGIAVNGFVVVHDPGRRIAAAAILAGGRDRQPLREFTPGYWVGRPRGDGSVEVRCRGGARETLPGSYVTPGAQTALTVGDATCRGTQRERALARSSATP